MPCQISLPPTTEITMSPQHSDLDSSAFDTRALSDSISIIFESEENPCTPGATISLQWIHHLIAAFDWSSKHLPPSEFPSVLPVSIFDSLILTASKTLLRELNCLRILESSVASSGSTVVVVGDIHGQFHDLLFEGTYALILILSLSFLPSFQIEMHFTFTFNVLCNHAYDSM